MLLVTLAHAQESAAPARPGFFEGGMIPMILIFMVFYFLIIRPQSKQRKEHEKLIKELKRGDNVLTSSGILGTIEGLTDKFITLEISEDVRIKILRSQIAGLAKEQK